MSERDGPRPRVPAHGHATDVQTENHRMDCIMNHFYLRSVIIRLYFLFRSFYEFPEDPPTRSWPSV